MLWCTTTKRLSANPYHVLGLTSKKSNGLNYSLQELRTAFYARAKEVHPDAGGSAEQFRELRQAYDAVRSECKQYSFANHSSNMNSMYANKGFYNHPHAQWSRAQYDNKHHEEEEKEERSYNNNNNSHFYSYWSKPESEWMKSYAQKCKNGNERFYAKQREAQQQRMEKEWQDYKTAWNDLNSRDWKSTNRRREQSNNEEEEEEEECPNDEYEQWFRSAPQYANYSSWYFYRPYNTHVNEEFCKRQYENQQSTTNNQFTSSSNRMCNKMEREWAEAQRQRKQQKRYNYHHYHEKEERRWVQLLIKSIVVCIGAATVYYSYNTQTSFETLQKEQKERRKQYIYNYEQLRNTYKHDVKHQTHHIRSSVEDHNVDSSERIRKLERYRSSPQTVPHVIRYQGRPFTPDGVRAGKNVAVKTAATFEADKTYELYDDDENKNESDVYKKDCNKVHVALENNKQDSKRGVPSKADNNDNSTVKVTNEREEIS